VSGLRQEDDEGAQLVAVTDLCELLSISTEDNLASFPVEQITPLLVSGGGMAAQSLLGGASCGQTLLHVC
jgi:E3 ubiquitin-protein ligase TRIP12